MGPVGDIGRTAGATADLPRRPGGARGIQGEILGLLPALESVGAFARSAPHPLRDPHHARHPQSARRTPTTLPRIFAWSPGIGSYARLRGMSHT